MKTKYASKVLVTVVLALMSFSATGEELNLLVNGYAHHLHVPANVRYNERNTGVGFQYDLDQSENNWRPFITASGFKDSEYNMSYYAGGGYQYRFDITKSLDNLHFDVGAVAFLMFRKNFREDRPFPGVLPAFTIGTDHLSVNITYIPKVDPKMIPLWFFQLKVPLTKL